MDRFDRFSPGAQRALTLAQDESQRLDHNYIGTEHLLLGLVREGEGVAARVLENMDVELAKVRTAVEFIIGRGDRPVVGEVGLTPRAKRVIELAIDEARRLRHDYIGTEHLLLGLVREGEGIAAGVLESLGVSLDRARREVLVALGLRAGDQRAASRSRGERTFVSSGSPYEATIGFSRAVRLGGRVIVSGTAPIWPDGSCDPDPAVQARRCLEIVLGALEEAGATADDVIRTRIYLTSASDAEAVGRVHGEVFGEVRPASTMVVVAALLDPRWKVEIEAEAVIG